MGPNRFGRILGVSARVAADKVRERSAQSSSAPAHQASSARPSSPATARPAAQRAAIASAAAYADGSRRLARGAGRFGAAIWRPFAHATGVLTLQITGVFFALFTLFFTGHAWQVYKTAGRHDSHFLVYTALAVLFLWFAVSSFWRASRRGKQ